MERVSSPVRKGGWEDGRAASLALGAGFLGSPAPEPESLPITPLAGRATVPGEDSSALHGETGCHCHWIPRRYRL